MNPSSLEQLSSYTLVINNIKLPRHLINYFEYYKWLNLVNKYTNAIINVPSYIIDEHMAIIAINKFIGNCHYIPKHIITKRICRLLLQTMPGFYFIPDKLKDREICLIASTKYISAFRSVPIKDEEICAIAVKKYGHNLRYVPEHLKTRELCRIAILNCYVNQSLVNDIPIDMLDKEMCILIIKNSNSLKYIPFELRDMEICLRAVRNNGYNLKHVPHELKTKKMCIIAIRSTGCALKYVPNKLKSRKLCSIAILKTANAIQYLPDPPMS